jgi:hypothetical protein
MQLEGTGLNTRAYARRVTGVAKFGSPTTSRVVPTRTTGT